MFITIVICSGSNSLMIRIFLHNLANGKIMPFLISGCFDNMVIVHSISILEKTTSATSNNGVWTERCDGDIVCWCCCCCCGCCRSNRDDGGRWRWKQSVWNDVDSQLYDLFNQAGQAVSVRVCKDLSTRRSLDQP
ncbi:hypothetical protein QVD17_35477 [Tagetes erecta]|uniref:Uncharacterized protein n=1 Tax=Tagetes erecta TaxID=13708 RepID=A0AAD8NF66_TARER|nr:hypothetical protein QVD17_35477 [Tagetes erecta]